MAMTIPASCSVLVVGGGPGGSYAATLLAREGIDVVLLESETFPRYHIGESMLPSFRHFLRFIDLDEKFLSHGFIQKNGAAFKLVPDKQEGFTDFLAAGPDNFSWNVIRSESDDMLFRHAADSGAHVFDGTRVDAIQFSDSDTEPNGHEATPPRRPVSALYKIKSTGVTGTIKFNYLVDASGRAGIMSAKYLKNRDYNPVLKNIAYWGYWKGTSPYAPGTKRENTPFFEALRDETGWAWEIPLHNGTTWVGIVMNQAAAFEKRKKMADNSLENFYLSSLEQLTPNLYKLLASGKLTTKIDTASDYSYNAPSYAAPYTRVVGDAGCFIDPFWSSGVHIALTSALSAATTICATIRGECDEEYAGRWHTKKVKETYDRFLVIVMSAYRQISKQGAPIWSNVSEDNFDHVFDLIKPIIQGTTEINHGVSQNRVLKALDFVGSAFNHTQPQDRDAVLQRLRDHPEVDVVKDSLEKIKKTVNFSPAEMDTVDYIRARRALNSDNGYLNPIAAATTEVINGMRPNLQRGKLGLVNV